MEGKAFTCPECGKVLHGAASFYRHKKQQHGKGPSPKDAASNVGKGQPSSSQGGVDVGSNSTSGSEPQGSFYPTLDEWRRTREEPEAKQGPSPAGPTIAQPGLVPVAIDLTGFWMAAGNFIDDHMPSKSKVRVDMDPKKAETLNEGLRQMGLYTLPSPTIVVPNWTGLVITAGLTFGLPLMVLLKEWLSDMRKKRGDGRTIQERPSPPPFVPAVPDVDAQAEPITDDDFRPVINPIGPAAPPRQTFREPEAG